MGMFDTILVKTLLPLKVAQKKILTKTNWENVDFQTKDLENMLGHFEIRKNGSLYLRKAKNETKRIMSEKEEAKIRKSGKFCWPYETIEKNVKYVKFKHTGDVCFYTHLIDDKENEWWVEFKATFVEGDLKGKIKQILFEFRQTAEQIKKNNDEFEGKLDAHYNHPWTRTKRFLNKITFNNWRMFWVYISRGLSFISNRTQKLSFFLNRHLA